MIDTKRLYLVLVLQMNPKKADTTCSKTHIHKWNLASLMQTGLKQNLQRIFLSSVFCIFQRQTAAKVDACYDQSSQSLRLVATTSRLLGAILRRISSDLYFLFCCFVIFLYFMYINEKSFCTNVVFLFLFFYRLLLG